MDFKINKKAKLNKSLFDADSFVQTKNKSEDESQDILDSESENSSSMDNSIDNLNSLDDLEKFYDDPFEGLFEELADEYSDGAADDFEKQLLELKTLREDIKKRTLENYISGSAFIGTKRIGFTIT